MRSIRFGAVARTTPKSFHRGGFGCYLLSAQKVTYEKNVMPPSRRARIGIANGWLSEEILFIFLFQKRKMWNDADDSRGIGLLFADGGRSALAVRREGAAANCAVQRAANTFMMFPPFVTQKVEPKCAAVKRFRSRPSTSLNRMPAALLKQSKFRLRRRLLASAKLERVRL